MIRKNIVIVVGLLVLLGLPLSVMVMQRPQDIRQHAASPVVTQPVGTIDNPPVISFLTPQTGVIDYHQVIPVDVQVTGNPVKTVSFFVDGKLFCAATQQPYVCNWPVEKRGQSYELKVITQDAFGTATSAAITVTPQ